MRKLRNKKMAQGFTIIELLIVVVVIAILAAISIIAYSGIQERARKSAEAAMASQAEHQIMAYGAGMGYDTSGVSGKLVGYQEGAGQTTLLQPLTGAPDITVYTVYDVASTSGNYITMVQLDPDVTSSGSGNGLKIMTGGAGGTSIQSRIDTSAQQNITQSVSNVRVVGTSVVCWAQVSNNVTTRAFGCNDAAGTTSALSANSGLNFTSILSNPSSNGITKIVLVFNTAHDQTTRASVIGWLAQRYNVSL